RECGNVCFEVVVSETAQAVVGSRRFYHPPAHRAAFRSDGERNLQAGCSDGTSVGALQRGTRSPGFGGLVYRRHVAVRKRGKRRNPDSCARSNAKRGPAGTGRQRWSTL